MNKREAADRHNYERWLKKNAPTVASEKRPSKKARMLAATILAMGAGLSIGSPRSYWP